MEIITVSNSKDGWENQSRSCVWAAPSVSVWCRLSLNKCVLIQCYYSPNFCIVLYFKSVPREQGSDDFLLVYSFNLSILENLEVPYFHMFLAEWVFSIRKFHYSNGILQILNSEVTMSSSDWGILPILVENVSWEGIVLFWCEIVPH